MPNVYAVPHVNPFHIKQHVISVVSTVIHNPFGGADIRDETQRLRNMSQFSLHEVDQFLKKRSVDCEFHRRRPERSALPPRPW